MNKAYNIPISSQEELLNIFLRKRQTAHIWFYDPSPSIDLYKKPKKYIARLSTASQRILNELIRLSKFHRALYPSQSFIGRQLGYTREYVNKQIKILEKMGLVFSNYRHMNTSIYRLAKLFTTKRIKKKLGTLLPALLIGAFSLFTQYKIISSPIPSLCNIESYSYLTKDTHARAHSCARQDHPKSKTNEVIRKTNLMTIPYDQQATVDAIKQIKSLKLTRAGKIYLSRYNSHAIIDTDRRIRAKKGGIVDPFAYFEASCNRICKDLNMGLDNSLLEKAYLSEAISSSDPMLEENKIFTESYYDRPDAGARAIYVSPAGPQYQALLDEREKCISMLNSPFNEAHAMICSEESYYKWAKKKFDEVELKIENFKDATNS